MKAIAWTTFVFVMAFTLSLTNKESIDQRGRNFINTLEQRNRGLETQTHAMTHREVNELNKIQKALDPLRDPSSVRMFK